MYLYKRLSIPTPIVSLTPQKYKWKISEGNAWWCILYIDKSGGKKEKCYSMTNKRQAWHNPLSRVFQHQRLVTSVSQPTVSLGSWLICWPSTDVFSSFYMSCLGKHRNHPCFVVWCWKYRTKSLFCLYLAVVIIPPCSRLWHFSRAFLTKPG